MFTAPIIWLLLTPRKVLQIRKYFLYNNAFTVYGFQNVETCGDLFQNVEACNVISIKQLLNEPV